ncbi:cytochrome P450 [Wolfiporia cocos MD-104 SS10]|uniref:Cytochrome P450 n=1 Tax=Wolfiporia cocos (strain MD-104) TaxID=742152 RepID=A0A2H3JQH2_WOLCO|nr:cytochrome P450 [Wolfiporia cocos MD-104 SS10]
MDISPQLLYFVAGFSFLFYFAQRRTNPLHSIPTVGFSAPLLTYLSAARWLVDAQGMLQEGYAQHKIFKISSWDRWMVFVSGPDMNEELSKMPDDVISVQEAAIDLVQSKYTIGENPVEPPIEVAAIRGPMTRNLSAIVPDVVEEVSLSIEKTFPQKQEWVEMTNMPEVLLQCIACVENRIFVGAPICREPEYIKIVTDFAIDVMKGKLVMDLIPMRLRPTLGPLLPWRRRAIRLMKKYLGPVVAERQKGLEEHGAQWDNKPDDFLMWIVEGAWNAKLESDLIYQTFLSANFAALHASSLSMTQALYQLACLPECIQPLREEIMNVVAEDGWTRNGFNKMWKLDSFIKETQRYYGIAVISLRRKTLKTATFSNGVVVPPGVLIAAAAASTHFDDDLYEDATIFKPFRFVEKRKADGEATKHQFVSSTPDYVFFGLGRHACPGRFFVSILMKALLAKIILDYDVKIGGDGSRPSNLSLATTVIPSSRAKVLFRRRQSLDG